MGAVKDIDIILKRIRSLGITVTCANDLSPPPGIDEVLEKMVINEFSTFTDILNIDCTILLALVSDISHSQVVEAPWFNAAIRRQLEMEAKEQLLPSVLWPGLKGRRLVCTSEAATRMREIVDFIGTETEQARSRILMGDDRAKSGDELVRDIQVLSEHQVPSDWRLPISIVDFGEAIFSKLPPVAAAVAPQLTDINKSIFLYGWAEGITTVSSNRTVAKLIENIIGENHTDDEKVGPDIWVSPTSRSLVAKEKERRC